MVDSGTVRDGDGHPGMTGPSKDYTGDTPKLGTYSMDIGLTIEHEDGPVDVFSTRVVELTQDQVSALRLVLEGAFCLVVDNFCWD